MDLTIIVVNWNTREHLRKCLGSIETTVQRLSYETIVVDNASTDGSVAMLRESFPGVRLIENLENRGFGAANNQALRVITGRYALLLNSDAVLKENAVSELFACMEDHPEAAMACGQLLNSDDSRQNSVASFPSLLTLMTNMPLLEYLFPKRFPSKRYNHIGPVAVDSAIGACLMVRGEAMETVGLFDERYHFFFEETDWAYRMQRAGWKVLHVPSAFIYHLQGQSIGRDLPSRIAFYRARYQFFHKWRSRSCYLMVRVVILLRLVLDWLLTSIGIILTLGLVRELRKKWTVYGRLLVWHLRGCP
jgi:GT2 family glycosyltransferase